MTTGLHDPCNHAPALAPDDDWGDSPDMPVFRHFSGGALPPIKRISEVPGPDDAKLPPEGLRIEAGRGISSLIMPEGELEVREISGKVVRLAPEDTEAQKVPRQVVFHPRQKHARPDIATAGESKDWGMETKTPYRWMIAGGSLVILAVAAGLGLQPLLNKPTSKGGLAPVSVVEPEVVVEGIDALNDMILKQAEAEAIFTRFARAADADDFIPWVRSPVATEPIIRKHPYRLAVGPEWTPPRDCAWGVFTANGLPCATLEGDLPEFRKFSACFVLEDHRLLLDWKATIGHGTADFDQLAAGLGDPSEIRGWLQPTTHYTAVFPEADFAAFQLLPPEGSEASPVWCYARRSSVEELALERLFPRGEILEIDKTPEKVTLMLQRGDPASAPNQWLVVKLLHKQWISP